VVELARWLSSEIYVIVPPVMLSPHLSLAEMVASSTAERLGIDNTPTADQIQSLTNWAMVFFEPVRAQFGPCRVSSGYRCTRLNAAVGGVPNDAHEQACGGDIQPLDPKYAPRDIVKWVAEESKLPFDQVIYEHDGVAFWCHLGGALAQHGGIPRQQALDYNGTAYVPWVTGS
jgi:hypothetical protein